MQARNPRKVCSRIGFAFAAMLVMVLCAQFVLSLLAASFAPWFIYNEAGYWLLADASIYLCGAPVFLLILRTLPHGHEGERERLRMTPLRYLLVLVVCLGVAYAANFVTVMFLAFVEAFKGGSSGSSSGILFEAGFLVSMLFGAVVPALGEEFLFRYCLRRKLRGAGDKIYILVSALCFAVFHMNMGQLIFTFFVGAIFAWIYTQTGSIWYSVSLHFLFNSVSLVLSQLEERLVNVLVAYVGLMFAFVAISVTTLVRARSFVRANLRPPEEPGWPYKPPVAKRGPVPAYAVGWQGGGLYGYPAFYAYGPVGQPLAPPYAPVPGAHYGVQPSYPGHMAPVPPVYPQMHPGMPGAPAPGYGPAVPPYAAAGMYPPGMPPQNPPYGQPPYGPMYGTPFGQPVGVPAYPGMAPIAPQVGYPAATQPLLYGNTIGNKNGINYFPYNQNTAAPPAPAGTAPAKVPGTSPADCPELTHAAYNNMPQNRTPPAYQNMRPVWANERGPAATAAPPNAPAFGTPLPPLFGQQTGNTLFKTCFVNPGMVLYLTGGFIVILLSIIF